MAWTRYFKSQNYNQFIYKHKKYPIFITKEFDFFRCVRFDKSMYNTLATDLFNNNLRDCEGRYSTLFPGQKVSYWADSVFTARAEARKHGAGGSLITFWAYDDASSFEPINENPEYLLILDGRKSGVQILINKLDEGLKLTSNEREYMKGIFEVGFDAISYDSVAYPGGENFIFLESGFKKLALREIRLRLSKKEGGNSARIYCAGSSDYLPYLKGYGEYFAPKCRVLRDENYLNSEEYSNRCKIVQNRFKKK